VEILAWTLVAIAAGAAVGGVFLAGVSWSRRARGPAERRKEDGTSAEALLDAIEGEDGEEAVEDRLKRMERNLRMLTGRVNKVSPPRLGTGEPKAAAIETEGNGQETGRPMSRAELYAAALRRRRHAR